MNIALLFPGQGSQEPGMTRDLAELDRDSMDLWKKAERISGLPLREIYWDGGDESAMADTRSLQVALTTANLVLWRKLASKCSPAAVAGHSLGEYSALAAAGVLPVDAILELVALRGRLMSEADPTDKGGMAAIVKLSLAQVKECVAEAGKATGAVIIIANYNTPAQFVVSGDKAAIAKIQDIAKEAKGRSLPLPVAGAFHSPLMNEAAAELSSAIDGIGKAQWNKARFPIYCNAAPKAESDPERIKELLKQQMTSSVYFIDTITRQWDDGCRVFVECGPKGVLGKMVGAILQEHAPAAAAHSEENPAWRVLSAGNMQQIQEFSL